jgi:nucleotide-binding universal stress UspA family protein
MINIKKILVALEMDFEEGNPLILAYAHTLAAKYKASVQMLHVMEDLNRYSVYLNNVDLYRFNEKYALDCEDRLKKMAQEHLAGHSPVNIDLATGDPAWEIVDFAKKNKVDLVILGTHGRKGLEFALFGSVARRVITRSPVPVLTVNPSAAK